MIWWLGQHGIEDSCNVNFARAVLCKRHCLRPRSVLNGG
jgi:hypothetical protein